MLLTDYNYLSAARLSNLGTNKLNAKIDSSVRELSWVDVNVTCDVCSVVRFSHAESPRAPVLADETAEAVVDVVSRCTCAEVVFNTQTVEPV